MTAVLHRAFAVWLADLDRWDPMSYHGIDWNWPDSVMAPVGSVLRVRKENVDRTKHAFTGLQPITIHFDGSVDRRKVDSNREYSMDVFFARPGDIVVAKIDLKNGAVGIVPGWKNVVVTGHFAVYEPDRTRIVPEYFERIIQASFFKAYLWRNKVGAEGRKEVKLDFFEATKIPIPPLATQRAILAEWRKARQTIAAAEKRIEKIETETERQFFADLGLETPGKEDAPKCFAVPWTDFLRWSVSYNQTALTGTDLSRGRYPVVQLGSVLQLVQYGTSEKANTRGQGMPVVRMNNIVNGTLDISALKHVELGERERRGLVLQAGDILFNRTNSKELVGKCAVFHDAGEFVFASYLIRVRVKVEEANSDFVAHVLNSPIGRQQINAMSRQIIGQANINSQELRSLKIPLPPLDIQRRIIGKVSDGRARIARERETARTLAREIEADMEAYLLGTKKVGAQ
jgi:type I restriction enzyme S subunit